jgi:hypothetical protein
MIVFILRARSRRCCSAALAIVMAATRCVSAGARSRLLRQITGGLTSVGPLAGGYLTSGRGVRSSGST